MQTTGPLGLIKVISVAANYFGVMQARFEAGFCFLLLAVV
jgi:hypothetical protein